MKVSSAPIFPLLPTSRLRALNNKFTFHTLLVVTNNASSRRFSAQSSKELSLPSWPQVAETTVRSKWQWELSRAPWNSSTCLLAWTPSRFWSTPSLLVVLVKTQPVSVQVVQSADKLSTAPPSAESTRLSTLCTRVLNQPHSAPWSQSKNALLMKSSMLPRPSALPPTPSAKRTKSRELPRVIVERYTSFNSE